MLSDCETESKQNYAKKVRRIAALKNAARLASIGRSVKRSRRKAERQFDLSGQLVAYLPGRFRPGDLGDVAVPLSGDPGCFISAAYRSNQLAHVP